MQAWVLVHVLVHVSLCILSPRHNDGIKKGFLKVKKRCYIFFFLRQCVFNAIGADIKYHKVRDMRTFVCVDLCVWLGRGGRSGADTGITLTV